jgi:membrane protease YdiL (CAAX protease family)
MTHDAPHLSGTTRRMSIWAFVAVVVVYLAILQGLALFLTRDVDVRYAAPTTSDELWRSITVPVAASLVFVTAIVGVLGWWRPVLVDGSPVASWTIAVPITMFAVVVLATNYGGLADRGLGFTLLLLVSMLMVGLAEEGMFRGLGVTVFRKNGFSEGKVALWSSVVFGLAHSTNLISTGPKAFVQVLVAALAGYFLYLIRRRSGGLLVPALIHGLWDFSLVSAAVVPGKSYLGPMLNVLAVVVLAVVVITRRHHIEPTEPSTDSSLST